VTYTTGIDRIINFLRKAVSSSLGERYDIVSIEIKELTKVDKSFVVRAIFEVAPFFTTRTGNVFATLLESEKGLEITSLKIDEKGL
jgi:hypothetical protein